MAKHDEMLQCFKNDKSGDSEIKQMDDSNQMKGVELREDPGNDKTGDVQLHQDSLHFFHSLGLQNIDEASNNATHVTADSREKQAEETLLPDQINNEDVTLDFFHSLGLQTLQEASRRPADPRRNLEEARIEASEAEVSGSAAAIEDNLWSSVSADISFVDALGLYWLNPGTDGKLESHSSQAKENDEKSEVIKFENDKTLESENRAKNDELDLDDCLNFLDFNTKPEMTGKRWRLWNPVLEGIAGCTGGQMDTWENDQETDPTLVEVHANKLGGAVKTKHVEIAENEEFNSKFKNPNSNSLFYCEDCKRSISSKELLNRHLKSKLHAKNSSFSSVQAIKQKTSSFYHDGAISKGNSNQHRISSKQRKHVAKSKKKQKLLDESKSTTSALNEESINRPNNELRDEELPDDFLHKNNRSSGLSLLNSINDKSSETETERFDHDKTAENKSVGESEQTVQREVQGCLSCGAAVQNHQLGKHLVSHYHYHRSIGHKSEHSLILDNIETIIHQSPYQCQPCKFYCNWHRDLKNHAKSHQISGVFWCLICDKVLNSNSDLCLHLESEDHKDLISVINRSIPAVIQRIDLVSCLVCDKKFRLNLGLKKHMVLEHGDLKFQLKDQERLHCQYCDFSTFKQKALVTHQFLVHKEKRLQYICKICYLDFGSAEEVKVHRNSLEHKENVDRLKRPDFGKQCEFCWKQVPTGISDLKKHLESDHLTLLPQCNICGQLFYFSQQLRGHVKSKCRTVSGLSYPPAAGGKYTCTWTPPCSFTTHSEWRLLRHRRIKHREKVTNLPEVKCEKCYRKFQCKEQLESHISKYHKENLLLKCDKEGCKYETLKEKLFKLHMKRTHPCQQTIYICSVCTKQYGSKSALNHHTQVSHNDSEDKKAAVYCCETAGCGARFQFKCDLDRHNLKHTDSRSFCCELCSFSTKRKSDLTRHMKHQHDENQPVLECHKCDYKTKNSTHMKRHRVAKHGESKDKQSSVFLMNEHLIYVDVDEIQVSSDVIV